MTLYLSRFETRAIIFFINTCLKVQNVGNYEIFMSPSQIVSYQLVYIDENVFQIWASDTVFYGHS